MDKALQASQKQVDLKKEYGFFQRFGKEYRTQKAEIGKTIKQLETSKTLLENQAKYNILKTYEDRGVQMTSSERRELRSLTKEAQSKGYLKEWNDERAGLTKPNEGVQKTEAKETKTPTVKQLDLSEQIHKPKEAPVQEIAPQEKVVEKVVEGPNLEI